MSRPTRYPFSIRRMFLMTAGAGLCLALSGLALAEEAHPDHEKPPEKTMMARADKKRLPGASPDASRTMEEMDTLPVFQEILTLEWSVIPRQTPSRDSHSIGLDRIFHETLKRSLAVRQAEINVEDVEAQAKEIRDPNLFNLLNPLNIPLMNKAAENNVQSARARLQAVRQASLLEAARMYADLTQAFLAKYLAYQAIEQGRGQLRAERERFTAGETNRFDVTQTQMALIDRYSNYLNADNLYYGSSVSLAGLLSLGTDTVLVPEGVKFGDEQATVPLIRLISDDLSLETILKATRNRPDGQASIYRREALQKLVKASSGLEKEKKKTDLHQLELEIRKAESAVAISAEKAYADYLLSRKKLLLAQERHNLACRFAYQLEVSHMAGFSSSKEALDGQMELIRVKTGLIGAQVAYNLSQIRLLYEMGLLSEDVLSRSASPPTNTL